MFNRLGQSLDFAKFQGLNFVFHNLTGAPASPVEGQTYQNTVDHKWYVYNGTAWIDPRDRANHTGTQTAATISDFDTQVRTSRLDQMAAPTASVSLNNQKIINLATPTAASDAANKSYVDGLVNGTDWKNSVRAGTTANITLSGTQTIDGVTLSVGDRVLVKDQTTGSENGIYVVASGAWSRSADASTTGQLTASSALFIEEGTLYADTQWRITTNGTITIGTTAIVWAQFGAGSTYTAGNGISIAGAIISVDPAVVTRKFAQTIGDGTTTSFTITHNLNTLDVQVQVREVSTGEWVIVPHRASSTSQCIVEFGAAPATNTYRVIVQG